MIEEESFMFRRIPGPAGYTGDRLGLWEYQSETEATEMIHQRRDRKNVVDNREQERPLPNYARQATWGK